MSNDYFNPPSSVWPNGLKRDGEGYVTFYPLGTNKVDISTITWPEGDKLVSPFVYQNDKLVGFVDTKALTVSGSATTTMNYSHIEADFASISEGKLTVNAPNATVKKITWAISTGSDESFDFVIIDFNTTDQEIIDTVRTAKRVVDNKLYDENDDLIGTWDTSKIEVGGIYDLEMGTGDALFNNITFTPPDIMEQRGLVLSEFNSDLSSLRHGSNMFSATNLTTFTSDLHSLTDGVAMFGFCVNLTSFTSNLSSLTNAESMFCFCVNLTTFSSNLSSLTNGKDMFYECKLDAPSVKNIIETINTYSGQLTLGMGCNSTNADRDLFTQEIGYTDMASLLATLKAKGWTVTTHYTGRPTTTYSLRKPSEDTLPVFVKLEEVDGEVITINQATHTNKDGSILYRLNWFHETTGSTDGHTQFNSIEEAIETLNIKPIERN